MSNDYGNSEVTFEILEHIGVIATFPTGWKKEINFVSWNGAAGKYDIREWDPSHERMSRGITLKENEMRILLDLMRRRRGPAARMSGYVQREDESPAVTAETAAAVTETAPPVVEEPAMTFAPDEEVEKELTGTEQ